MGAYVQFPDAKTVQINLTGFLESNTAVFMSELWEMLSSAQSNVGGVPTSILEAKKAEILAAKVRITLPVLVTQLRPGLAT
jgi:serine/arginine repetitive matrix protein 1